ncbi:hypothetical protein BJ878DRAFT_568736 [Calycina marina]|uniref:DNA ligase n=1 Tax=Calycina marina TaxID=1763456 RepID=A0A9P8CDZ0_9HELO|nr:hypothetical protein BJ878DRAFT_568736 [Calycina marina]
MSETHRKPNAEARNEDDMQYGHGPLSKEELDEKYPDRPHNSRKTLRFCDLYLLLFDPLIDNLKKPKTGPGAKSKVPPHERRRIIINNFISKWRKEVGYDLYPVFRLIMPDKDRDRPVYGLKEAAIAKLLIKVLKIDAKSEDALKMTQWKSVVGGSKDPAAGDFAGRCYGVLDKRIEREKPGDMSIAEVNRLLDKLALSQSDKDQQPIFEQFFDEMNADEIKWLIRIIVKQMKIGTTEKTIFGSFHPAADALFNVSTSLRRVCWELWNPGRKLENDETPRIELMSCFKPQLAQFQHFGFAKMIECLNSDAFTEAKDRAGKPFWVEEKLDGERMQMHMEKNEDVPGGYSFSFWSRKGKDYTYLYGSNLGESAESAALTFFIKNAFDPALKNIIVDGEMIEWDYNESSGIDSIAEFGSLKTAALGQQKNSFKEGRRPLFRVFDCLFINDRDITKYKLCDRYKVLKRFVKGEHRRLEIHPHKECKTVAEIETELRDVIDRSGEGLVLKNPDSDYRLNERNDMWMKVKPEYMDEFGENLDCVVIGGYYGSGHRGGYLSSFLCGLRADQNDISKGADPEKFYSFFKVGGGFRREDYEHIRHITDGKWRDWDPKRPPTKYIGLGGGPNGRAEVPDQWIRPSDSFVVEAKAASVVVSESFATRTTLRFPRFRKVRSDKGWQDALSKEEFRALKERVESESKPSKEMTIDSKRIMTKRIKLKPTVAGAEIKVKTPYAGPHTKNFEGIFFFVMTDMGPPQKKSKAELEQIVKSNGGSITQNATSNPHTVCVADKQLVKVKSLIKSGQKNIVKPAWILDAIKQAETDGPDRERLIIQPEPQHMLHTLSGEQESVDGAIDMYNDSYARDVTVGELKKIFDEMALIKDHIEEDGGFSATTFMSDLEHRGRRVCELPGSLFRGTLAYFGPPGESLHTEDIEHELAYHRYLFAGGKVTVHTEDRDITHVIILNNDRDSIEELRVNVIGDWRTKTPRMVKLAWIQDTWKEGTRLDEERYVPVA